MLFAATGVVDDNVQPIEVLGVFHKRGDRVVASI